MARLDHKKPSMALYENILKLKNVDECRQFFEDLCTVSEARAMEQRFDVAVLLTEGKFITRFSDAPARAARPSAASAACCPAAPACCAA